MYIIHPVQPCRPHAHIGSCTAGLCQSCYLIWLSAPTSCQGVASFCGRVHQIMPEGVSLWRHWVAEAMWSARLHGCFPLSSGRYREKSQEKEESAKVASRHWMSFMLQDSCIQVGKQSQGPQSRLREAGLLPFASSREGHSGMQHVPCCILQKDDGPPNVHSSSPEVSGARHWNRRAPKMPGIVPCAEVLARNLFACRFLEESCFRLETELPGIHGLHRTHYKSLFDCND